MSFAVEPVELGTSAAAEPVELGMMSGSVLWDGDDERLAILGDEVDGSDEKEFWEVVIAGMKVLVLCARGADDLSTPLNTTAEPPDTTGL